LGLQDKEYFFAFGSGGLRKGTDLTIKAFDLYQKRGGEKKLILLVPFSSLDYIKRLIQRFSNSIFLISNISNIERDAIYNGAIALLFPSRCEGFGYPILEAMCQGCPPIAAHNSPAEEIIGGCIPTLDKLNIDDIVNFMFAYEDNTAESQQDLASRLKLRANEFITQIDTSQKYIDLIQSIE
jgi:glycosyltransferase involved in cell wall biosynthesis